jgi:CRP-like cAMP-binding protein
MLRRTAFGLPAAPLSYKAGSMLSSFVLDKLLEVKGEDIEVSEIQHIQAILKLPPTGRSAQNIKTLLDFTIKFDFFKNFVEENSPEVHLKCCRCMTYEVAQAGETVCEFGEVGYKFYIILRGSVNVLVPSKQDLQFDQVAVLEQGKSFGELALTRNMPRAARIVCREETSFAVLQQKDFKMILGRLTEQALKNRVAFLQELPFFSFYWTEKSLAKLSYYFKELKFTRKQVVYRQGEHANDLYFIKEGEFQLSRTLRQLSPKKLIKSTSIQLNAQVALLGRGEFFGDDEAIEGLPRNTSCGCHSSVGVLLSISKENFEKRLSNISEYMKERRQTKNWAWAKRIENFSSLASKGHLPSMSYNSSSSPASTRKRGSYQLNRLVTERIMRSPSGRQSSSPFSAKAPDLGVAESAHRVEIRKARTNSLEHLALPLDMPVSVLSFTQRHKNKGSVKAKSPSRKKVINIHTKKIVKTDFKKSQSARNLQSGALPLFIESLTPARNAHCHDSIKQTPISLRKFEVHDEDKQQQGSRLIYASQHVQKSNQ